MATWGYHASWEDPFHGSYVDAALAAALESTCYVNCTQPSDPMHVDPAGFRSNCFAFGQQSLQLATLERGPKPQKRSDMETFLLTAALRTWALSLRCPELSCRACGAYGGNRPLAATHVSKDLGLGLGFAEELHNRGLGGVVHVRRSMTTSTCF